MRIEVVDRDGSVIAASRELAVLQRRFGRSAGRRPAPDSEWSRRAVSRWDFADLPDSARVEQYGTQLALYPALLDVGGRVDLELIAPGPAAAARHRLGVRRLLLKQLPQQTEMIRRRVLDDRELVLSYHGVGTGDELVDDVVSAAADDAFELDVPIRTSADFDARLERGRAELVPAAERLIALARGVLAEHRIVKRRLERAAAHLREEAVDDLAAQLDALVHPRFLQETPSRWRAHLPRYLKAVGLRLDRLAQRAPKDAEHQAAVHDAAKRLEGWRQRHPPGWPWPDAIVDYRWLLEELRVSLFAQGLGTSRPVSGKRLEEAWRRAVT
jgi:ATP-dependent helicase HrpA